MNIKVVIVDDEPLAIDILHSRLSAMENVEVTACFKNGPELLNALSEFNADVIFLDIEMPEINGLALMKLLEKRLSPMPKVVFVTAFKEFAIDAFDLQATDYLLKPVTAPRLCATIDKIKKLLSPDKKIDSPNTNTGAMTAVKLSLKIGNEWIRIYDDEVDWIEAAGDYMCIYTSSDNHIIRSTLQKLESELNPLKFKRISRSSIVNWTKVVRLSPNSNGEYIATLVNGQNVKVTRKYKVQLSEIDDKFAKLTS